jgi:hypothetical protein
VPAMAKGKCLVNAILIATMAKTILAPNPARAVVVTSVCVRAHRERSSDGSLSVPECEGVKTREFYRC